MILENVLVDGEVKRNFEKLAQFVLDTGGITAGVRFGTGNAEFVAATNTGTITVSHGLGTTPQFINVFPAFSTVAIVPGYIALSRDADSFQFRLDTNDGSAITATVGYFWLVIG